MIPAELLKVMSEAVGEKGIPSPLAAGSDPFSVLVGTVISLRTRDAVTGPVTERVLKRTPDPRSMDSIDIEELALLLKPAGFFNRKARQLKLIAGILLERHNGRVPDTRAELEALPGVGGKTAAFVLSMGFGKPAVCVDVHVHRISNRLGLVETGTPGDTEKALMDLMPRELWIPLNHVFVRFGQRICLPRRPSCPVCPLNDWCRYAS